MKHFIVFHTITGSQLSVTRESSLAEQRSAMMIFGVRCRYFISRGPPFRIKQVFYWYSARLIYSSTYLSFSLQVRERRHTKRRLI